jgi:hypothetical protein
MNINIEINDDQLGEIITNDLADAIAYFQAALTKEQPNIFSLNAITDKIMIMKHIEAFKLVQEWYI